MLMGDLRTKFTNVVFVLLTPTDSEVYLLKEAQGLTLNFSSIVKSAAFDFDFVLTKLNFCLFFEEYRLLFFKDV
jgi:hypothetical protein